MQWNEVGAELSIDSFNRLAFLAGSGISVASGLPSGWAFNTAITDFLSIEATDSDALRGLVISGYDSGHLTIRFEQLMNVLRERIDPELEVLGCFDEADRPTALHDFLARALCGGAAVFTTNFDSLIEAACDAIGCSAAQVYVEAEQDAPPFSPGCSFEAHGRSPARGVLKLHGTIRDLRDGAVQSVVRRTIGATLDRIGSRGAAARLEPFKEAALRTALQGRVLCVLGYSGADDFDVVPSLAQVLGTAAGLIWIRHDDVPAVVHRGRTDLLPPRLRTAALGIPTFVIGGRTTDVVAGLFGPLRDDGRLPPRVDVPSTLASLAPYRDVRPFTKRIVAARIAEEATRLDLAVAWYEDAVRRARRRDAIAYAYAMFRLGHHARGRDTRESLRLLRAALRTFRRIGDRRNVPLVLNAIGTIYLDRGPLSRAIRYYQEALEAARALGSRRFEATVLNNLGLVEKKRGRYQDAIGYYDQAYAIDLDIRERAGMSRDQGNRASALLYLERYDESLAAFEESIALNHLLGRRDQLAIDTVNRGVVYRRLGRLDEAQRAAEESLVIERELGRKQGISTSISLLGGIAASRGDWHEAVRHYREAVAIETEIGRRDGMAADLESLGEAYNRIGDFAAAADAYRQSRAHYHAMGNEPKAKELARRAAAAERHAAGGR